MIRSGKLAYEAPEYFLGFWELENSILNSFLIAAVTALLAYKIVAITFDLALGFKPHRQARISELYGEHLAHNLSPFAMLSDFLRNDALTRRRFNLPADTPVKRTGNRVPQRTVLKVALLLLVAPIVNIASITLALEHDTTISFDSAKFAGVALGVTDDPDLLSFDPLTENCNIAKLDLKRGETHSSDFSLCNVFGETSRPETVNLTSFFMVRAANHMLGFALGMNGQMVHFGKFAFLRTERGGIQQSFHINMKLEQETLNYLANIAVDMLAEECGVDPASAQDVTDSGLYKETKTELLKAMVMTCTRDPTRLMSFAKTLGRHVTLVESDRMKLYEIADDGTGSISDLEDLTLLDGGSFPLFVRRRRNVSFLLIAALAFIGIVAHIITRVFCHNDLDVGNEIIMKKAVGLQCCDSGLWEHQVIVDYTWRDGPGCMEIFKDGRSHFKSYCCEELVQ